MLTELKGPGEWVSRLSFQELFKNNSPNNLEMTIKEATSPEAANGDFEFKNIPPWLQSKDQEVRAGSCLLSLHLGD